MACAGTRSRTYRRVAAPNHSRNSGTRNISAAQSGSRVVDPDILLFIRLCTSPEHRALRDILSEPYLKTPDSKHERLLFIPDTDRRLNILDHRRRIHAGIEIAHSGDDAIHERGIVARFDESPELCLQHREGDGNSRGCCVGSRRHRQSNTERSASCRCLTDTFLAVPAIMRVTLSR
jgi:hypothetical protein